MKVQMRNGYENYINDLHKAFVFLSNYSAEIIEERSDGSFFIFCIKLINTNVKTIKVYHEFVEQQLIVTLQIENVFIITLELNKNIKAMNEEDLSPQGDNYLGALYNNAQIIKRIVVDKR